MKNQINHIRETLYQKMTEEQMRMMEDAMFGNNHFPDADAEKEQVQLSQMFQSK